MSAKKVTLKSQSREIVENVRDYFQSQCATVRESVDLTHQATKVPARTIYRIKKEKKSLVCTSPDEDKNANFLSTPKRGGRKRTITEPGSFDRLAICQIIYNFYRRKEYPTLDKLLQALREQELFDGGRSSLQVLLHNIGFKYKKHDGRKLLMERSDIVYLRTKYLRTILYEIDSFYDVVWIDETWVNVNHTMDKCWTNETLASTLKQPIGKGGRLIVTHAGNSHGFIPGAKKVFRSKKSGDYHDEMNAEHFMEWFRENLLPGLSVPSVIVMDNAPYHSKVLSKVPNSSNKKEEILTWLRTNHIQAHEGLRKIELLELVKRNKPPSPRYIIDELAAKYGHKIVRLPPYHCQFNPIELIWANVKGYVRRNNTHFTFADVERLTYEAIERITPDDWRNAVDHCLRVSKTAWSDDEMVEHVVDEVIISVTGEISSESESESDGDTDWDESIMPLSD
ncbi:hypothetical protein M8J77_021385 [Diaphorina citri]|nr:hypothetical protein M8J77_002074 [Diaphorina citri]KAI5707758.1 hypothetical protein M8J77_009247 [Diaphorina citri]KAI5707957.1 hypothetical protein M8J77_013501 [Diaphorina citri]KAI5708304.1 hypothetical protein M8J77_020177 [Diaphorina citri]KAI5708305.1 hypothetical protein M8J77_020184 [Diaphorina citri]